MTDLQCNLFLWPQTPARLKLLQFLFRPPQRPVAVHSSPSVPSF